MENLAPAGNRAALERADAAGADAVYLGYAAFSARAGAGNFDREELAEAIRYAHLRHMRVYVTVNTLIKDGELADVLEVLRLLCRLQADGVLVQDLGVLRLARACFPGLAVHASTQMAIHNRQGVRWCAGKGIRRVVLARECSLEEIRQCCAAGAEIEVFGHGAQCVSVSGMCLFSSMVGDRSGNRGRCAQPCRMTYDFRGREGAWLSPRDVCLRDDLPALEQAGVASLKLEGRLKRPEYVAVTASSYQRGLQSLRDGAFRPADAKETEGLLQAFNRGGFMRGYACGCEDAAVICPERVNHQGLRLGRVSEVRNGLMHVRLERALGNGDGLAVRHGRETQELLYSGPDREAGETAVIRLREGIRAAAGDEVDRLTDARQMAQAASLPGRTVPVDLTMRAMPGEKLTVTASDGENTAAAAGDPVETAKTRPSGAEELWRNLSKTGGTVFTVRTCSVETQNAFVPVSEVNRLRREALEKLAQRRTDAFAPDCGGEGSVPEIGFPVNTQPPTAVVRTEGQARAVREQGCRVVWYPEDWREEALERLIREMPAGDWLRLPDVCSGDTLDRLHAFVTRHAEQLGGVVLGSVGQLGLPWPVPYGAGSGIPVMNRQAAMLLTEEGCAFVTASQELTGKELRDLTAGEAPVVVQSYGRTQLMLLHHCPARTALGLSKGHRDCRMCDDSHPDALEGNVLGDRRGYRFPLLRQRLPEGCLVRLMNTLPTDLLDRKGFPWRGMELTTETEEEARMIAKAMKDGHKSGLAATAGHWNRPVE